MKAPSAVIAAAMIGVSLNAAWAQSRQEQRPAATPTPAVPSPVAPPAATTLPSAPAAQAGSTPAGPQVAGASASGWATSCASLSRQGSQDCTISQSVQLARTGQVVARVSVRVPGDTRQAAVLIELPLGLHLPAGVRLQVDDGRPSELPFQTCQAQGCLAGAPLDGDVLGALKTGKQLTLATQFSTREPLTLSLPLDGFASSFERVQ